MKSLFVFSLCLPFVGASFLGAQSVPIPEVTTLPSTVTMVPTAIPAFIGQTERLPAGPASFRHVSSLADYESAFGRSAGNTALLHASMRLFYANGGGTAYVYSIGTKAAEVRREAFLTALAALEKEGDLTLILFPDAVRLSPQDLGAVQQAALTQCRKLKNRFCIFDVPSPDGLAKVDDPVSGFRANIGQDVSLLGYGAVYGPWLRVAAAQGTAEAPIQLPASGAIAGIYAAADAQRGVWKAPMNVPLTGALGLTETINDQAQESLNAAPDGKSINVIRTFAGRGLVVWGARTLSSESTCQYVPQQRFLVALMESIRRATLAVKYETNDQNTWVKVKSMISRYLHGLWSQGALAGSKPEEAFSVQIGLGESMTPDDLENCRLRIGIGVALLRPSEFVVFQLTVQTMDQ